MKTLKKIPDWLIVTVVLVFLGVEVVMETRYPCDEVVVVSRNTEAILRRVPQVEITEEDRDMAETLFQCTAVQELLEGGENGDLSAADHPELMAAAEKRLPPESAVTVVISAVFYEDGSSLYVNWQDGDGRRFVLERLRDGGEWEYYKLYVPEQRTTYESWDNERAQKTVVRRRWLAWLRDRAWEE